MLPQLLLTPGINRYNTTILHSPVTSGQNLGRAGRRFARYLRVSFEACCELLSCERGLAALWVSSSRRLPYLHPAHTPLT